MKESPSSEGSPSGSLTSCPQCRSTVYAAEGTCQFCGHSLRTRTCPYCHNTIPFDEDPCHHCGRLEPAELPKPSGPTRTNAGCSGYILPLWLILAGLAMIIWPAADPIPDMGCDPDELMDCFLSREWGTPGGIALIVFGVLLIAVPAVVNAWREKRA